MTCQLHKSWISDAQLLAPMLSQPTTDSPVDTAPGGARLPWLATACNDGSLSLWDTGNVDSSGRFSRLASDSSVHSRGIFSMHLRPQTGSDVEALTCSKDCSVALTGVRSSGISVLRRWDAVHGGCGKAVRWRCAGLAATAGNNRCCFAAWPSGPHAAVLPLWPRFFNSSMRACLQVAASSGPPLHGPHCYYYRCP